MTAVDRSAETRRKVNDYRARLRANGLRPVQLWVPDVRLPAFRETARVQACAVAASAMEADDQAFLDSLIADG